MFTVLFTCIQNFEYDPIIIPYIRSIVKYIPAMRAAYTIKDHPNLFFKEEQIRMILAKTACHRFICAYKSRSQGLNRCSRIHRLMECLIGYDAAAAFGTGSFDLIAEIEAIVIHEPDLLPVGNGKFKLIRSRSPPRCPVC